MGPVFPTPFILCSAACGTCPPATPVYREQHVGGFCLPYPRILYVRQPLGPFLLLPLKPMSGSPWDLSPDTLDYGKQHVGNVFLSPVAFSRQPARPVPLLPYSLWEAAYGSCLPNPRKLCPEACGTCPPATTAYGEQHVDPVFPTPVNYTACPAACGTCPPATTQCMGSSMWVLSSLYPCTDYVR